MASVHTHTRTVTTLQHGDIEVDLELRPDNDDDILVERVGNKLVVGYLVLDDAADSTNPMTNTDCQGKIYTWNEKVDTDDKDAILFALGLTDFGWSDPTPDLDRKFELDGRTVSLRELVQGDLEDLDSVFSGISEEAARGLYRQHWQRIAGPYVVVMGYNNERGETRIFPTSWDGDWEDMPNCVWVADQGAEENIVSSCLPEGLTIAWQGALGVATDTLHAVVTKDGTIVGDFRTWGEALKFATGRYGHPGLTTLHAAAIRYAKTVCEEYAQWCSGEVFGCVTEVFELQTNGKWETLGEHDSVWGHIGHEWAKESLKNDVDLIVERLKKEST